ncbi:MAG: peptide deformylase [Planctomycetes bacterium]|nr:peptide deformylase [Planctomycetota bacterium]
MGLHLYPDPVLRKPTEAVTAFDDHLADLARRMVETMHANNGLGLAGPQVGVGRSIVIVSHDGRPGAEVVMVNPEIVESDGTQVSEEGCLSFPAIFVKIRRFERIRVRYQDVTGQRSEIEAEGLFSRAIQHECDHLQGRLLVDRMSAVQRMAQRRRLRELKDRYQRQEAGAEAVR